MNINIFLRFLKEFKVNHIDKEILLNLIKHKQYNSLYYLYFNYCNFYCFKHKKGNTKKERENDWKWKQILYNEYYKKVFNLFLKEEGIQILFDLYNKKNLSSLSPLLYIRAAFKWSQTIEGEEYWDDVDRRWIFFLQAYDKIKLN